MTERRSQTGAKDWRARISAAQKALGTGRDSGHALVDLVDELLRELGQAAGWDRPGRALVALGGYGRREFAPQSDVDLLFLTRRAETAGVDAVLYPLWDLGFDVGHALRTPADCADLAATDLSAATAFLDARLLLGDTDLLRRARHKAGIRREGSRQMRRWIPKIVADVAARRSRFGEVSHLLEPHIKEGSGGLRDLQAARWALSCLGEDPDEWLARLLGRIDVLAAVQFLSRTRNALHAAAGRKTDHLTFEFHEDVATLVDPGRQIDHLFEAIHRASHHIVAAWTEVEIAARQALLPPRKRSRIRHPLSSAEAVSEQILSWSRHGGDLPDEIRLTLTAGDRSVVSAAVQMSVARALRSRIPLAPFLYELHRLGLLDRFAPELEAVAHQVHYDARHAFTTGIHCIECLRAYEDLWLGGHEIDEPHLTRICGAVLNPHVVRLAALCHDLGKVRGVSGHESASAEIARELALRLDFARPDADEVARLVLAHHVVPAVAFGGDLEDRTSWEDVRQAAGSASAIDALVALAFADLVATNPRSWAGLWSDWKRDLLLTLHARARGAEGTDTRSNERLRKAVQAAGVELGFASLDDVWERIPPREALQVPPDLLADLLALAHGLDRRPTAWRVETRRAGMVEVLGVVQPLPRVLSSTTGALTRLGFDILSFQAHTWADGTTHLWLRAAHRGDPPSKDRILTALTRAVTGQLDPPGAEPRGLANPRDEALPVATRIRIQPDENPFYSVLEVQCRDRAGLVRDLAWVFEDLGLTLEYALVTTHGPAARDVFHLKDIFGGRIDGADKRKALLERVERAVYQGDSAPSAHPATGNKRSR